jgi:sugar diacid utilization regulator
MVPLAALVHPYLIAQREISAAIVRYSGTDAESREAALTLIAATFDYNIATVSAMAEAYVDIVQGDLAELDSARRGLVEDLLSSEATPFSTLTRLAIGLGLDPDSTYVVALTTVDSPDDAVGRHRSRRWAAQAIARSSGRPERSAFVVSRERDVLALLEVGGPHRPRVVVERAAAAIGESAGAVLRTGVGPAFSGLSGFSASYQKSRPALKHTNAQRRLVFAPEEILLFDELAVSRDGDASQFIPTTTREVLADPTMRTTLEAFVAADLNVANAASALSLHPNTLRYRLDRLAERSGRDPRTLSDLLELLAAARIMRTKT